MGRSRRRCGCPAIAASTAVHFFVLMTTVIDSLGDPVAGKEFPAVVTNRCSDFDLSEMTDAMNCGSPLSAPCFDFSRCRDGPTVYVYDEECSLADSDQIPHARGALMRMIAKQAGVLADTYESACFFINMNGLEVGDKAGAPQCATKAPLWNEGRNHVMIDDTDYSRDQRPSYSGSYAMEASSSQHTCYYRSGYDISFGIYPGVVFPELQAIPPDHRRYFLTFKGTLHMTTHGSEERESIRSLHNDAEGIVVAEKCHPAVLRWLPDLAEKCDELLPRYNAYDFQLLMNSTFGLAPAGISPASHRLGEVMSAGCIPVFVTRDYVKPFTEEVDWSEFSFTFSPDEVPDMIRVLRSVPPGKLKEMQERSIEAYPKVFGVRNQYGKIYRHIMDTVVKRIGHLES